MSKCLLVYSYSAKNAGDMAITIGALDQLTSIHEQCSTISRYTSSQENFFTSSKYFSKRYKNLRVNSSPLN